MDSIQPRSWHRLTLAAGAAVGIALSAILAVHYSNTQIEARRYQLIVEATGFTDDLEQYLQGREMIAKTVGTVFEPPELSAPHPLGSIGNKVLALTPEIGFLAWIDHGPHFARLHVAIVVFDRDLHSQIESFGAHGTEHLNRVRHVRFDRSEERRGGAAGRSTWQ